MESVWMADINQDSSVLGWVDLERSLTISTASGSDEPIDREAMTWEVGTCLMINDPLEQCSGITNAAEGTEYSRAGQESLRRSTVSRFPQD